MRTAISKALLAMVWFVTALTLLGSGIGDARAQLVAAYGFNEGTGTTTANLAGTGNSGTLTSTTWSTAGQVGNALTFNGATSRVNVADSAAIDLTTGMTLEAWVFPTSLTGTRTVIAKERTGGFAYALFASNGASLPSAAIRVGATTLSVTGPASLPLNAWSHLAATYNGSALVLYVNGTKEGLMFPPNPGSEIIATIGGMLSTNASGHRAVKYGTTKDYIKGLKVVRDGRNHHCDRVHHPKDLSRLRSHPPFLRRRRNAGRHH